MAALRKPPPTLPMVPLEVARMPPLSNVTFWPALSVSEGETPVRVSELISVVT